MTKFGPCEIINGILISACHYREGRGLELEWWVDNVMTAKNVMTWDAPMHTLTTDASNNGWGAVYGNQSTGGLWSSHEKSPHIN